MRMLVNPFSSKTIVYRFLFLFIYLFFFFRKFIANLVFMLERYIRRPLFLEKGLNIISYKHEKTEKSSQNEIFRQMTMTLALMLDVN